MLNKLFFYSLVIFSISCNQSNDANVFESENIRGKYSADFSSIINEITASDKKDDKVVNVVKGIASLAMSSVKVEFNFYENNKGVMHLGGGVIDFMNAFSDAKADNVKEFVYKVENDSVLFMKGEEETEFHKWAIVKKYSESYDYLKLLILKDGEGEHYFNLHKLTE
ncbi:MAG: hypothetical protein ACI9U0_000620 [Flavobacteriales bacterium]|jgi:hypothetical protein